MRTPLVLVRPVLLLPGQLPPRLSSPSRPGQQLSALRVLLPIKSPNLALKKYNKKIRSVALNQSSILSWIENIGHASRRQTCHLWRGKHSATQQQQHCPLGRRIKIKKIIKTSNVCQCHRNVLHLFSCCSYISHSGGGGHCHWIFLKETEVGDEVTKFAKHSSVNSFRSDNLTRQRNMFKPKKEKEKTYK